MTTTEQIATDRAADEQETVQDEQHQSTEQPTEDADQAPEAQEGEEDGKTNEAAKYRKRLRETEAERDALRDALAQARDFALDHYVAGTIEIEATNSGGTHTWHRHVTLKEPSDLFTLGGLDRAQCWNENGTLDTEAISKAAQALYESRSELFERNGPVVPTMGQQPDRYPKVNGWQGAFAPKNT